MHGIDMNLSFNLEKIYENCNFIIENNDKVGITGVNGAGKTTLFQVILGNQVLDSGKIEVGNKQIGYLPQEIILEDKDITVLDYLMSARPIQELENKLTKLYEKVASTNNSKEQNKLLKQIGKIQANLEYYDCYQAESILFDLIENMDIDIDLLDCKLKELSGGQKSKIAFAHLLYSKSEVLLLDEPTNHLDIKTRTFITSYLKHYKGMVLIISHDIPFLDSITNKTLYIDKANHAITVYEGNYTEFLKKYEKQKELKERIIEKQEKENEKLRDIVLLYSNSSGKRKRMAQSREKMLEKNLKNTLTREAKNKDIHFKLKPNQESGKIPLKVNNIVFGYSETPIIRNLSFTISRKERFLIVGENGVGKSTLLKLLVGILKPEQGKIWWDMKTEIAYYAQEQEELQLDKTIYENMDEGMMSEREIRSLLSNFLFQGDDIYKKVKYLSPGERARLCLCKIMMKKANFLLLDEPTNHLDPKTQEIIGRNFKNYEGTIILVSHNPQFVSQIGIDRMLILPEGRIQNYSEELLEYYYQLHNQNSIK